MGEKYELQVSTDPGAEPQYVTCPEDEGGDEFIASQYLVEGGQDDELFPALGNVEVEISTESSPNDQAVLDAVLAFQSGSLNAADMISMVRKWPEKYLILYPQAPVCASLVENGRKNI